MMDKTLQPPIHLDENALSNWLLNQFESNSRSSEELFQTYPQLRADDQIRVLTIWTEYKYRLGSDTHRTGQESITLSEISDEGTCPLEELIRRFPDDAEALREQHEFECAFMEESTSPEFERQWQGDRFELIEKTGQGWFCAVYLANDLVLRRRVAVKVPHPGTPQTLIDRFRTEAQSLARLNHPNIVTVYDFQPTQTSCLLVCEYIADAVELATAIKQQKTGLYRKLYWMEQVASALTHSHANGIVHRDVKPTNILVAGKHAWLNDFGLSAEQANLPQDGELRIGSPAYMAPEQLQGQLVTEKVDIYSFGVVLRELFGDKPPRTVRKLIERSLEEQAERRPTAAQCMRTLAYRRTRPQRAGIVLGLLFVLMLGMFMQWRVTRLVAAIESERPEMVLSQLLDEYLFLSSETGAELRAARVTPRNAELSARITRQRARLDQLRSGINSRWPMSRHARQVMLLAEAELCVADGESDRAIALLQHIGPLADERMQSRQIQLRGEAHYQQQHWDKSLECFDLLVKLTPPSPYFTGLAARSAIHLDQYERALKILDVKLGHEPKSSSDAKELADLAMLQMCRATVSRLQGDYENSETSYLQAIQQLETIGRRFNDADYERAMCYYGLATLKIKCGKGTGGVEDLKNSEALLQTVIQRDGRQDAVFLLVNVWTANSQLQRLFHNPHAALDYAQHAVELLEARQDLDSKQVSLELPIALTERGSALATVGQLESGRADLQRAIDLFDVISDASLAPILATALANQGYVLHELNILSQSAELDAVAPLNRSIAILESLSTSGRTNFPRTMELARAYMNRGCAQNVHGGFTAAGAADLTKAEKIYLDLIHSSDSESGVLKNDLIVCRMNLASAYNQSDRVRCLQTFEEIVETLSGDSSVQARTTLALVYFNRSKARLASVSIQEANAAARESAEDIEQAIALYDDLISSGQTHLASDRERCNAVASAIKKFFEALKASRQ